MLIILAHFSQQRGKPKISTLIRIQTIYRGASFSSSGRVSMYSRPSLRLTASISSWARAFSPSS